MFIILGIVILLVSFVVALVSLVREQGKSEEEIDDSLVDGRKVSNVVSASQVQRTSVTQPQVLPSTVPSLLSPTSAPVFQNVPPDALQMPDGGQQGAQQAVSLQADWTGVQAKDEQAEDRREIFPWEDKSQRSIEEIKAELAKIAGEKGHAFGQSQMSQTTGHQLKGEISLRDIKSRD